MHKTAVEEIDPPQQMTVIAVNATSATIGFMAPLRKSSALALAKSVGTSPTELPPIYQHPDFFLIGWDRASNRNGRSDEQWLIDLQAENSPNLLLGKYAVDALSNQQQQITISGLSNENYVVLAKSLNAAGALEAGCTQTLTAATCPTGNNTGSTQTQPSFQISIADINKDENFLGGTTLTVPYTTTLADNDYAITVTSEGSTQTTMTTKAIAAGDVTILKTEKNITIKCSSEGSSTNGIATKTTGLKYKIAFTKSSDNTDLGNFIIEQDDINRAREEYHVIIASTCQAVPARSAFKSDLDNALYVGTAYTNFGKNFLCATTGGIDAIHTKLIGINDATSQQAKYSSPYYSCSWRAPYHNKSVSTATCSPHVKGAACDSKPAGSSQTAQDFSDQFDDIKNSYNHWILEQGGKEIRIWSELAKNPSSDGWKKQAAGDPNPGQLFSYIDATKTPAIEDGYKIASHYHLEDPK